MSIATTTAVAIGGIASAGAGIAGGILAKKGADKQADAATQASQDANATQLQMYNQNRQDLAPWRNAGGGAVSALSQLVMPPGFGGGTGGGTGGRTATPVMGGSYQGGGVSGIGKPGQPNRFVPTNGARSAQDSSGPLAGFNTGTSAGMMPLRSGAGGQANRVDATTGQPISQPGGANPGTPAGSLWNNFTANDFQTDPGYDFRLSEGSKALERSAAAKGSLFSGGTLKDLTKYNQDFASNEYQNAYNRFQTNRSTQFNQLASLAGLGQTAAGTTANLGANTANQVSNNTISGLTGAAAARASGYNAIGNSINSGIGGLGNWYLMSQLNGNGGLRNFSGGGAVNYSD